MNRFSIRILLAVASLAVPFDAPAHGNAGAFAAQHDHDDGRDEQPQAQDGLTTLVTAVTGSQTLRVQAYGRVRPAPSSLHHVNSYISGQIEELFVRPGETVKQGDPIATVHSPQFILTQKSYLALLANDEKLAILREEGRLPDYLKDARQNLFWWGMGDDDIERLVATGEAVRSLTIHAPAAGVVSDLYVEPGTLIDAGDNTMKNFVVLGRPVARIVSNEPSRWLEGYLYPDQLAMIDPGRARVRLRTPEGHRLTMQVTRVMPELDPTTQLARFVVELGERSGAFPLGALVDLELIVATPRGVWIPREAVMHQGLKPVVFVESAPGNYEPRRAKILMTAGEWVMTDGITSGERVVTRGKTLLEGARRMSRVKAEQTDDHRH